MRRIAFEYKDLGVCFDIELVRRVTVLGGLDASGRSFFFNCLKKIIRLIDCGEYESLSFPSPEVNKGDVVVLNYKNVSDVANVLRGLYSGFIVCIDNGDYVLAGHPDLAEYINTDYSNFYIIAARGQLNLDYDMSNESMLKFRDGMFILKSAIDRVIDDLYHT